MTKVERVEAWRTGLALPGLLEDTPEGLNELRGALIRDHEQRNPV